MDTCWPLGESPCCSQLPGLPHLPRAEGGACRTKYIGEGSAACLFGLTMGFIILILQNYLTADAVHQLLTFNPIDFFTCGLLLLRCPLRKGHE